MILQVATLFQYLNLLGNANHIHAFAVLVGGLTAMV